jgi:hypothetical protein
MSSVLYRFDDPADFPILDSQTTGPTEWHVAAAQDRGEPAVRVSWRAAEGLTDDARLCLALPRIAIDGSPGHLGLSLRGDGSGVRLLLDATDARGPGFSYSLGSVLLAGVQTYWADMAHPTEYWDGTPPGDSAVRPPVQLHRLVILVSSSVKTIGIVLLRMVATGNVRLAHAGLA